MIFLDSVKMQNFPINESWQRDWNIESALEPAQHHLGSFLLMNPGNGIETPINKRCNKLRASFPINESWQRDWNKLDLDNPSYILVSFLLMNPGNGIETQNQRK